MNRYVSKQIEGNGRNNSNFEITLQKNSISFKSRIWRNMYQSLKCFKYHHLGGALETKRYVNVFIHFKAPTTHTHTHVACTHSHTPHTYPLMPTDTLNLINNMKLHVNRTNTKKARKIEKGRNKSPLKHFSGLKRISWARASFLNINPTIYQQPTEDPRSYCDYGKSCYGKSC